MEKSGKFDLPAANIFVQIEVGVNNKKAEVNATPAFSFLEIEGKIYFLNLFLTPARPTNPDPIRWVIVFLV